MIWTEQVEQQAHHLAETLTEAQWDILRDIAGLMNNPIRPKANQEAEKEALARRKEAVISIREWRKDKIKDFRTPTRYDMGSLEMVDLIKRMTPSGTVDKNLIWDGLSAMYDYGFKRGMACQMNLNKKRVKP